VFKIRFLFLGVVASLLFAGCAHTWSQDGRGAGFAAYEGSRGAVIFLPATATKEERTAAELLQSTLTKATGAEADAFPIREERRWRFWHRGFYVGKTHKAESLGMISASQLERPVGARVFSNGVVITSAWREDAVIATSWFLEKYLGVHWFMPGELGESIPRTKSIVLNPGQQVVTPSYRSRNLSGLNRLGDQEWYQRNRLRSLFSHGHNMSRVFTLDDLKANPELAPLVSGKRFIPQNQTVSRLQPNIASQAAVDHAVAYVRQRFSSPEAPRSVSLSMADTSRFDQSDETVSKVTSPQFFRKRPNYSNLVFGFANAVAREVAEEFPDRYLPTYAYDWTEAVPDFRIEPNVVPYLTSDRSQWFDPAFEAEDRDLITRWVAAGSKEVGIYDYYYGAPFVVPRPMLYSVMRGIPFAHEVGVRNFYAECHPNWALDGPKLWLATQLLWDAQASPTERLDVYYRDFWHESAAPMREFFDRCDTQLLNQPLPSYWLKYYKDEHQYLLYPPEARARLRTCLDEARAQARSEIVKRRVDFVSRAFAASEAFCSFGEARTALSGRLLDGNASPEEIVELSLTMTRALAHLQASFAAFDPTEPTAIRPMVDDYLRNDPRRRALWWLAQSAPDQRSTAAFNEAFAEFDPALSGDGAIGQEIALDGRLLQLQLGPVDGFTSLEWVKTGQWRGHGDPFETRKISLLPTWPNRTVRLEGCLQEALSQWREAKPGMRYVGSVKVRAKVSPGNMTFLIVSLLDEAGNHVGLGSIDRLPVGEWNEPVDLQVYVQAPANVSQIGIGVRVLNQVDDDFAEFSELSLREVK
jgi:hypothetical protein